MIHAQRQRELALMVATYFDGGQDFPCDLLIEEVEFVDRLVEIQEMLIRNPQVAKSAASTGSRVALRMGSQKNHQPGSGIDSTSDKPSISDDCIDTKPAVDNDALTVDIETLNFLDDVTK